MPRHKSTSASRRLRRLSKAHLESVWCTIHTRTDHPIRDKVSLRRFLSRALHSTETCAAFTSDQLDLPTTWRIVSNLLSACGRGVAKPQASFYRHYTNPALISNARCFMVQQSHLWH
jgi:hypothetical protein